MATYEQADKARVQHAEKLRQLGAHAIAVKPGKSRGLAGYVICVTRLPGTRNKLPTTVTLRSGNRSVTVPIATDEGEPFKPEKL